MAVILAALFGTTSMTSFPTISFILNVDIEFGDVD